MSAETIIFRGAYLRYLDFRRSEPGWSCRLHMTADFTTTVAEAMGWDRPGAGTDAAYLEGELVAQTAILTPNDKALHNQERMVDAELVSDFKYAKVKDGKSTCEELRFIVKTSMVGAAGIIEDYARRIGQSASQLRVSYAKQESLPLEATKPEDGKPCESCAEGKPLAEGSLIHADGKPCTDRQEATAEKADGPAMVSAREMGQPSRPGAKKRNGAPSPAVN